MTNPDAWLVSRLQATIQQMKTEIAADVATGLVPVTVASFGDLHDFRDANCYGGICDDSGIWDELRAFYASHGLPDTSIDFFNAAQSAVDDWIKAGGLPT